MLADAFLSDAGMVLALLLAAAVLFLLEVCTPSFGILAILGVLALGGGVYYGFVVDKMVGLFVLVGCLLGLPPYLYLMVKLLPKSPLGKRIFLKRPRVTEGAAVPDSDQLEAMVGQTGRAETALRPSGVIRVGDDRVIALAEREMIDKGQPVRVIGVRGMNVTVRPVGREADEPDNQTGKDTKS